MVQHKRKPAPDVFLHAAEQLKIEPKACLVIEDHPLGIEAAKVAEMQVIGFLGASYGQNSLNRKLMVEASPNFIVNDSITLLDVLKQTL